MKPDAFRKLALELPEAVEASHMGHPDFRVGGKIFATLGAEGERAPWGMVRLTPEQQAAFIEAEPDVFDRGKGAWGRTGATMVRLGKARVATMRRALTMAWRNTAPKKLVQRFDGEV